MNFCALIVCFAATLLERPDLEQITCYALAFSLFMCTDPYDALRNVCAPQARYMCASVSVMILAAFYFPQKRFIFIVSFISVLSLILVVAMNKIWLSAFYWRNSEEVQKALRMDSEHTAARAWQAHGMRETYTLLCKLGLDETEKIDTQKLHIFYKPVYLCGYLHGIKKAAIYEAELERLTIKEEKYEELKAEFEELKEKKQKESTELFELKRQQSEDKWMVEHWEKQYKAEKKRADKILKANEELLSSISAPVEIVAQIEKHEELKEQTMQERIKECKAAGMSYKEIADFVGCSKSTAYKYANKEDPPPI